MKPLRARKFYGGRLTGEYAKKCMLRQDVTKDCRLNLRSDDVIFASPKKWKSVSGFFIT